MFQLRAGSAPVLLMMILAAPAGAASLCVNPAGTGNCAKTIGAAVAAAAPGDNIAVAAGTYRETVTIGKPLTISGEPGQTIIDATGLPVGIYIDGIGNPNLSGVIVANLTVVNAKFEGILATNASEITISASTLTGNNKALTFAPNAPPSCPGIPAFETGEDFDCGEAIHFSGVHHSRIIGNTVKNNAGGILLSDDTGATYDVLIADNSVVDNQFDCGITLASHPPAALTGSKVPLGVYSNTVIDNEASRNGLKGEGAGVGIFASGPGGKAYGNLVYDNKLIGNDLPGITVHGHTPDQNLDGNIFIDNQISGNGPDVDEAATPGSAGIAITSVAPVAGTVIAQNTIDRESIGVAWNAPGNASVHHNSFSGAYGVFNLGPGTMNADSNWWGCPGGPVGLNACARIGGSVTVTNWATKPFGSN